MDMHHVLEELAYDFGVLPREAIESAILYKEHITPFLLETLHKAAIYIEEIIEQDNYHGHLYAMYLLAQFRNTQAFPLIVHLMSLPDDLPHAILGDVLTEDLSRILASTYPQESTLLQSIVAKEDVNEYSKAAAIATFPLLVAYNKIERATVIEYYRTLFEFLPQTPSPAWDSLVISTCQLYPKELYTELIQAYRQQLILQEVYPLPQVQQLLTLPQEVHLHHFFNQAELIDDTVSEMEKWLSATR